MEDNLMFEKIKKFFKKQAESVKNALAMKEAQLKGCAHAVLDGVARTQRLRGALALRVAGAGIHGVDKAVILLSEAIGQVRVFAVGLAGGQEAREGRLQTFLQGRQQASRILF